MAGTLSPKTGVTADLSAAVTIMPNDLDIAGNDLINLAAPVNSTDAARKIDTEGITIPVLNVSGNTISVPLSK